ncbi:MAG: archaeoflavoprotein AfpA [Candidatus Lokiarchaeota archaeon]|nr:archaeoflavoprotein AfpA [Candidatus Lokiarchaeota archaeon]MBD3199307.1 archaeoflavoprotein AfpA [Candidatus Lokiarchaeota archaeon]
MPLKFVWGITGTGFLLDESINLMKELQEEHNAEITVMLSKAGKVVIKWYKKWELLNDVVGRVRVEKTSNNPFLAGPLQIGKYDFLLVCPVSANSVAKIVYGIADTLVTNCVAQTIKGGVPVCLLPSDQHKEPIVTSKPDGSPLILKIRDIEIENVEKLKKLEGITVLSNFSELSETLKKKAKNID